MFFKQVADTGSDGLPYSHVIKRVLFYYPLPLVTKHS